MTTQISTVEQNPDGDALAGKKEGDHAGLLRDLAVLAAGKYVSLLVMMVRGFVIPKLLDPSLFGIWKGLLIITDFSRVGHLGAVSALTREVPFHIGRGDHESLERVKNTAFSASVFSAIVVSTGILAASFFVSSPLTAFCLRWFAALVVLQQVSLFCETYLSGRKEFDFLSRIHVFRSVLMAVVSIGLAWIYGLSGLVWGTVLSAAIILILFLWKLKFAVRLEFPWKTVVHLVKIGFPLLATGILYSILNSIDKIMVIRWLGVTEMGYYSLGLTIIGFVFQLAYTLGQVLSPRLIERYSRNEDMNDVKDYVFKPLLGLGVAIPAVLACCYFASGWIYTIYLPKYLPGLTSLRILLVGIYFGTLWVGLVAFFLSIGKQVKIIPIYIAAITMNACLNYMFIRTGRGIEGVAVGTTVANCFFSIAMIGYAVSHFHSRISQYLRFFGRLFTPFGYAIASLILVEIAARSILDNPDGLIGIAARSIGFILLYAPMLIWGVRAVRLREELTVSEELSDV